MERESVTERATAPAPSGPRGYPIVGVLPLLFKNPLGFLVKTAHEYGDIVRMGVGKRQFYLASHPDSLQHMLQDNSTNFWKGAGMDMTRPLMGDGLAVSEGDLWRRQRRLMQPTFSATRVLESLPHVRAPVEELIAEWESRDSKRVELDVSVAMNHLTQDLLLRSLFRIDLGPNSPVLGKACASAQSYINYRAFAPFALPLKVPVPRNLQFKRALAALDRVLFGLIDERAKNPVGDDLLTTLLQAETPEDPKKKRQQIRDEMVTLLFAGHETTAGALVWTLYLLTQHPEAVARIRSEAERAFVSADTIDVSVLSYTVMVVQESMRLYPPGWIMVRTSREADVLCGYAIPAVATVLISPYVTHRRRDFWPQPEEFRPERFSKTESAERPRFAYCPYGGGPRKCIGERLASLIVQVVIARLCLDYTPKFLGTRPPAIRPLTTLQPKGAVMIAMEKH